ncbi:hypothetical protein COHA_000625 [Chlorella ohadii]|uniref:AAA domain-containing protein n=1 Tax=Chlorella ohadii TaxID=2649997 RepID=A0AAD5DYD0_9CHLO|nr:hypothetical protein COHA_000625 [Chlorella ohadii]
MPAQVHPENGGLEPTVESYGLWTNKGGVGKTTLAFHLSSAYAHLYPDKKVILVDMCPQSNLTHTVLTSAQRKGWDVAEEFRNNESAPLFLPRTVAGFVHTQIPGGRQLGPSAKYSDFLVHLSEYNRDMPENMWLLCGDNRLESMNTKLAAALSAESDGIHDPFRTTLSMLRNFFDGMVHDSRETLFFNQHVVVFFDTNPALTEYTKLALCSIDRLLVPVNADDFSLQALRYMFRSVWGLFPDNRPFTQSYERGNFATRASQRAPTLLPKIQALVHNRNAIYNLRSAAAFRHLHDEQAESLFQGYEEARARGGPVPVFADKGNPTMDNFDLVYTASMRDMLSAGVAGAATGTPMHRMTVAWVRTAVNKHFASTVLRPENISNLMADLLKVLAITTDDPRLERVQQDHLLRLTGKSDRNEVADLLRWNDVAAAYAQAQG